ncbi:NAD(P)-binding protein [Aestuariivirga sp. YIM B02566]|uniref:NAD(P)-binding protein n=1 Tax=Taklimakanibacter albus TaxID=2800327 RepID=A0ACC5QY96_9HYPH|nr:NAD(P)-binding protein [Aestuariivirga sp. YIM B02566]MBK1865366.1 NAD(P)-binding protein [Aestuariivirga sp. YIM B02566]
MTRDSRYDILFEPIRIGPVTARNRFYQVPHCNGMGYRDVSGLAAMRGMKAEGGWGVVCTEMVELHAASDVAPYVELRNWDDQDIPTLARIADKIHEHQSLAGLELCHSGYTAANLYSRETPIAPMAMNTSTYHFDPVHARAMDKQDIKDLRRTHRAAALRGRKAGYDLIYVYAGHGLGIFQQFLSRATNDRADEYGGSLENRARLLREVIEDTKDAVGDTCAVPVRIAMSEFLGSDGLEPAEVEDAIAMMAELPDLWDLSLSAWPKDSQTSRFSEEGFQEPYIKGVKKLTSKPVVGVGRYTSPDAMVRVIRQGIMDMIGAARPSIADPYLPKKIEEGRLDDIRECIGCNICVTGDYTKTPLRCTQNPSMGEEWRKGWHPEHIRAKAREAQILIIGAGPAGLEAGRALGQRGYQVTIADKAREAGGRVARECRLPGLAAWGRVRDWRLLQIGKMTNVNLYLESDVTADTALEFGADHIVCATGALWRRDGAGHHQYLPLAVDAAADVLTPDDVMSGVRPKSREAIVFDDDHYYMASVLCELLVKDGIKVTYVTPAAVAAAYTVNTMEQKLIQARLLELGVTVVTAEALSEVTAQGLVTSCIYTGKERRHAAGSVVLVTSRKGDDALYRELKERGAKVTAIGDAWAPAAIAHAVYAGRRFAEEFDTSPRDMMETPFRRELLTLAGS